MGQTEISRVKSKKTSVLRAIKTPILAFVFALLVGGIIIAVSGYNPLWVYYQVFALTFGSTRNVVSALAQATPLMFSGVAYAMAAKAGLVNLGLEGQMLTGAMTSALLGAYLTGLPIYIHLPICILGGAAAGGLAGMAVGWMKNRFGAREIIVCIMLNEIIALLVSYLCNDPLREEGSVWGMTNTIQDTAVIGKLVENSQLNYSIFLAVFLAIAMQILLKKTVLGYRMQVTGQNLRAAETNGIHVKRIFLISFSISGALAGLAGTAMILGVNYKYIDNFSDGYGWSGIAVAALAMYEPLSACFTALIFGIFKAGAMVLNRTSNVPQEFVAVIQALVVVFVAAPRMVQAISGLEWLKKPLRKLQAVSSQRRGGKTS